MLRYAIMMNLLLCLLLSAGCGANFHAINQGFDMSDGHVHLVDIKERAIVSKRKPGSGDLIVCSEPSADALSTLASQYSGNVTTPRVGVDLSAATLENATYVGLKTASIQLLRDQSYNLCQDYMNGVISSEGYNILIRRNQKIMSAILAIDQLTQMSRTGGAVTLNASIAPLAIQSNYSAGKSPNKAVIKTQITSLKFANMSSNAIQKPATDVGLMNAVVYAVQDIVNNVLTTDDIGQTCWAFLMSPDYGKNKDNPYAGTCQRYFKYAMDLRDMQVLLEREKLGIVQAIHGKIASSGTLDGNYMSLLMKLLALDDSSASGNANNPPDGVRVMPNRKVTPPVILKGEK